MGLDNNNHLRNEITVRRQSFIDEGHLDGKQLGELENLENEDNPDFIEEIFGIFLRDLRRYITSIEKALESTPIDHEEIESTLYRLKSCSVSIGAIKIKTAVNQLKRNWDDGVLQRVMIALDLLKAEQDTFKAKIEPYLELVREAKLARLYATP